MLNIKRLFPKIFVWSILDLRIIPVHLETLLATVTQLLPCLINVNSSLYLVVPKR